MSEPESKKAKRKRSEPAVELGSKKKENKKKPKRSAKDASADPEKKQASARFFQLRQGSTARRGRGGGRGRGRGRGAGRGGGWGTEGGKDRRKVCLRCRQTGHVVANCSQSESASEAAPAGRICYNCGSDAHALRDCPQPRSSTLPFATCFVCSQSGHIASQCPENLGRGMYPKGGGCFTCGSKFHLARDCPDKKSRPSEGGKRGGGERAEASGDEAHDEEDEDGVPAVAAEGLSDGESSGADGDDSDGHEHTQPQAARQRPTNTKTAHKTSRAGSKLAAPVAKKQKPSRKGGSGKVVTF